MKEKTILLTLLVVLVIATPIIYFYKTPKAKEIALKENKYERISYSTTTPYTKLNIDYILFDGKASALNEKTLDLINALTDEHKKISEENWKARYETRGEDITIKEFPSDDEKFTINIEEEIIRNDDIVSVVINSYEFSGGAHGSNIIYTFNYDIKNNKEITLKDYTKKNPKFLEEISSKSRLLLEKELNATENELDKDWIKEGTEPKEDNFKTFSIFPDGTFRFYFGEYQVAPYVFGISSVDIKI